MTRSKRELTAHVTAVTRDRVRLRGVHLPGPSAGCPPPGRADTALVVAHGFTNHSATPAMDRLLRRLARHAAVFAFDFRGHGRSEGTTSVGDREVLDIAAGVEFARNCGFRHVATLGFSLGAAVVLRHTALSDPAHRPQAVCAVSGPARWWVRDTAPMRRVHWLLEQPAGRLVARSLGVRLGEPWRDVPLSPVELADRVAPTPLLLLHGERDHYLPSDHAVALHDAAGEHGELWLERDMGHGEGGMTPALADRVAQWLLHHAVPPPRHRHLIKTGMSG